jgi:hypothetical protein
MKEENPIYVKLGYYESVESKKDILSSELSLLNMMKIIRRYNSLREEELEIKSNIYKSIRKINLALKKTQAYFPFIKIPEKAKKGELKKTESPAARENFDEDLESQLRNIQNKLRLIGR